MSEVVMAVNMSEAIAAVKAAGANSVRTVPMPGQNVNVGLYQIEVSKGGTWETVVVGLPKTTAESIISQAISRVICG
jgi:hypothetical protein